MKTTGKYCISPYLANKFCPKKLCLLISSAAYIQILIMEVNTLNPDQAAPKRSSLIWVHIVCNICHQSTLIRRESRQQLSYIAGQGLSHINLQSTVFQLR